MPKKRAYRITEMDDGEFHVLYQFDNTGAWSTTHLTFFSYEQALQAVKWDKEQYKEPPTPIPIRTWVIDGN